MAGWSCGACGQASPEGTRFCGHCGAPAAATAAPAVQTWSCRDCGTANPSTMVFCGGCGAKAQAARTEELRLVTALFADISGFTTLADTMDVESLHEVITPLVRGLTMIAERYGGFIEKFAGDALLVVYGAPVTHEDDAQRALLAALDMHAELPRLLAALGPHAADLTIHIGVNTGRVIGRQAGSEQQSDYAVLGDSVILAQRLESVCPSGQTYVGPATHSLCREEFEFESVGQLTLKGKLKPIEGFRLLGRRRTASATMRPLVGRDAELTQCTALLDTVQSGHGVGGLVLGEPGSGKSRLLAEVRSTAATRGLQWLAARCLSYGTSLPYWPFADLLRQQCELSPEASGAEVDMALTAALPAESLSGARRLLGLAQDDVDPQRARREVHDAVTGWLVALSATAPVVLCLEDVHWVDQASLDLLGELLRTTRDRPVALLMTSRPDGLPVAVQLLLAEMNGRRVDLAPLTPAAVPALVQSLLGSPPGPGLVDLLAAKTAGNPLFVEELTRSLRESGALVETAGGWDVKGGWDVAAVPETVERVFATRLDALPAPAAGLLQVASVVGRTVRLSLLAAVAGGAAHLQPVDSLVEAGLLERVVDSGERAITFHHALLHDVVYGRLLRKRKRELHRRVADVAQELYGDGDDSLGLLARHLYLAESGADAAEMLLRAGRRAAALYANDEAALHLERAVEVLRGLPDAAPRLPEVLLEVADIQEIRGEYDDAYRLYDEVRVQTADARAWRGLAAVLRKRGEYAAALELLDTSALEAPELTLERAYIMELAGHPAAARELLRVALDGPPVPDGTRARLLTQLASVHEMLGDFDGARGAVEQAIDLCRQHDDPGPAARAHRVAGNIDLRDGRLDQARAHLEHAQQLATRLGLVEESAGILMTLGFLHMQNDHLERSVEVTTQAVGIFERLGHGSGRAIGYGNIADAFARLSRWDEAEAWALKALLHARRIEHTGTLADASVTLARVRCAQQRWEEAQTCAAQAAAWFRQVGCEREAQDALAVVTAARDSGRTH